LKRRAALPLEQLVLALEQMEKLAQWLSQALLDRLGDGNERQ
jgi:hypothetical protein